MSEDREEEEADKALGLRQRAIEKAETIAALKVDEKFLAYIRDIEYATEEAREGRINFINKSNMLFQSLYEDYPSVVGKAVSKKERETNNNNDSNFVYGEIHFKTFALVLEKLHVKYGGIPSGGTFVDIGSGTGKAVFSALLLHDFRRVLGVEILDGLHRLSVEVLDIWNVKKQLWNMEDTRKNAVVDLVHGDALGYDWTDASVAFANSTCFSDELMSKICVQADKMTVGTFFISFTRHLSSNCWQVLEHESYLMGWGEATVYIHKKVR